MTKRQIILVFGIVIFLTPFLGISESAKYFIISLLGLGLIIFTFTLKKNSLADNKNDSVITNNDSVKTFVENNHNKENK